MLPSFDADAATLFLAGLVVLWMALCGQAWVLTCQVRDLESLRGRVDGDRAARLTEAEMDRLERRAAIRALRRSMAAPADDARRRPVYLSGERNDAQLLD